MKNFLIFCAIVNIGSSNTFAASPAYYLNIDNDDSATGNEAHQSYANIGNDGVLLFKVGQAEPLLVTIERFKNGVSDYSFGKNGIISYLVDVDPNLAAPIRGTHLPTYIKVMGADPHNIVVFVATSKTFGFIRFDNEGNLIEDLTRFFNKKIAPLLYGLYENCNFESVNDGYLIWGNGCFGSGPTQQYFDSNLNSVNYAKVAGSSGLTYAGDNRDQPLLSKKGLFTFLGDAEHSLGLTRFTKDTDGHLIGKPVFVSESSSPYTTVYSDPDFLDYSDERILLATVLWRQNDGPETAHRVIYELKPGVSPKIISVPSELEFFYDTSSAPIQSCIIVRNNDFIKIQNDGKIIIFDKNLKITDSRKYEVPPFSKTRFGLKNCSEVDGNITAYVEGKFRNSDTQWNLGVWGFKL